MDILTVCLSVVRICEACGCAYLLMCLHVWLLFAVLCECMALHIQLVHWWHKYSSYEWVSEFLQLCHNHVQHINLSIFCHSLQTLMDWMDLVDEINKALFWIHLVSAGVVPVTNAQTKTISSPPHQGVLWLFTLLVDGKFSFLCSDLNWYWILFRRLL